MTSHHITIAKASFAAACLRPDAVKLSRSDLSAFHSAFEAAVSKCSPSNVQRCKQWLLLNIVPSLTRTGALGKYMVSFSKYTIGDGTESPDTIATTQPRKQLHILYVLNDVLHHAQHHTSDLTLRNHLTEGLQPHMIELFQNVAVHGKRKVNRRLEAMLNIWEQEQYFGKSFLRQIRTAMISNGTPTAGEVGSSSMRPTKDIPYIMPATHGDPATPFYDLPAANLMPHVVPNAAGAIRPDQVRAQYLSTGPADNSLVNAVKDFLSDVKRMENPFASLESEGITAEMDELGQLSYRNADEELVGDTYYGWSRAFCDKMKKRAQGQVPGGSSRDRSLSSSPSRGRSSSPPKRRGYKTSGERSGSRGRSRYSNRSESFSPQRSPPRLTRGQGFSGAEYLNDSAQRFLPGANIPQPPFPLPPMMSNNMPIPPPRPANYRGPWPPPPPPPLPGSVGFTNMAFGYLPPPPPPPS